MTKINDITYICDEGHIFIHKETGDVYGNYLSLSDTDSIENYEEVEDNVSPYNDVVGVDEDIETEDV